MAREHTIVAQLEQLLEAGALTVVTDYDGTISPFVLDPAQAWPAPGAVAALQRLGARPGVKIAILTGRSRTDIDQFLRHEGNELAYPFDAAALEYTDPHSGERGTIYVIGGYGNDVCPDLGEPYTRELSSEQVVLRQRLIAELPAALAAQFPSTPITEKLEPDQTNAIRIEVKDNGIAIHTRSFGEAHGEMAEAIRTFSRNFYAEKSAQWGTLHSISGSEVEELSIAKPNKGHSITYLAAKFGNPILFMGDDLTDVSGFAALEDGDVGVVVGDKILEALEDRQLLDNGNLIFVHDPGQAVDLLEQLTTPRTRAGDSQVIIASHRLPVTKDHETGELVPSVGGLSTALSSIEPAPVAWVGVLEDQAGLITVGDTPCLSLSMSEAEIAGHYNGFSNAVMWPMYHGLTEFVPDSSDQSWWANAAGRWYEQYGAVNQRFADELAGQAPHNSTVWVHDYQLQLTPSMLRTQRPDLALGFFLHVPFPEYEHYSAIPHHDELFKGLLGSDVVGFQTPRDRKNFAEAARRIVDEAKRSGNRLLMDGGPVRVMDEVIYVGSREVQARNYPISIDYDKYDGLARSQQITEAARELKKTLGNRTVIGSVERLEYTKGVSERLDALELLLDEGTFDPREHVMYVSLGKSRSGVEAYDQYADHLDNRVAELNDKYRVVDPRTDTSLTPIFGVAGSVPPDEVPAVFQACDVMLITPLKDGMNLMAKEYPASRCDERGVLILGKEAGACAELGHNGAIVVDPRDARELANAMKRAITMPPEEQQNRMRQLRRHIRTHQSDAWSSRILNDLAKAQAVRQSRM